MLLPEDEAHIRTLKSILKESETKQDVITLREAVVTYQSHMQPNNVIGIFRRFLGSNNLLVEKLNDLFNQPCYQTMSLYAYEQVEQSKVLDKIETQLKCLTPKPSTFHAVDSPVTLDMTQLTWIKNPLEKEIDALKNDMAMLLRYQTNYPTLKYQVLGYLYYFVTAFANLPSKTAFEAKLPIFRYVIAELKAIEQRYLSVWKDF